MIADPDHDHRLAWFDDRRPVRMRCWKRASGNVELGVHRIPSQAQQSIHPSTISYPHPTIAWSEATQTHREGFQEERPSKSDSTAIAYRAAQSIPHILPVQGADQGISDRTRCQLHQLIHLDQRPLRSSLTTAMSNVSCNGIMTDFSQGLKHINGVS